MALQAGLSVNVDFQVQRERDRWKVPDGTAYALEVFAKPDLIGVVGSVPRSESRAEPFDGDDGLSVSPAKSNWLALLNGWELTGKRHGRCWLMDPVETSAASARLLAVGTKSGSS